MKHLIEADFFTYSISNQAAMLLFYITSFIAR